MVDEHLADDGYAQARRALDDAVTLARENERRAAALSDAVDSIRVTARSANDEVSVTARVGGRIEAVAFGPGADELDRDRLGALTARTIADAQHQAMAELARRGEDEFGAHSPIAARMRRDAQTVFPAGGEG